VGQIRLVPNYQGKIPEHVNLSSAFPSQSGDILNLYELEHGLENLRRVPTVDAELSIAPNPVESANSKSTTADVNVNWRQRFPLRLSLAAADSGISSTGKYQGTATVSYDNPFALNDLFYLSYTRDLGGRDSGKRGLQASSAHYSIPFGHWLLSFNTADSQYYQTVAGANQNILYSGASQNSEIKLSRIVYRNAYRKSTVSIKSWLRASQNYIDDTEVRVQRRRTAGWELGLNHREFFGTSSLDLSLNQRQGTGAFGARRAPEELFDEGTSRMRLTTTEIQLTNNRCKTNPDGSLQIGVTGLVEFLPKAANVGSLDEFLSTPDGIKMAGLTGGIQGAKGTLFGVPYQAGSWQDQLVEAFAGTHDMVGGKLSGLYDEQGNIRREMSNTTRKVYDYLVTPTALVPSTPFAAAELLSPEMWNAISILLKEAR
jgi:hypothetical protein